MEKYDKYKDSGVEWIGRMPFEWSLSRIKYHFTVIAGATPSSSNESFWDGNIPWITPADYKTHDIFVGQGSRFITKEGYDSCSTTIVPEGSIVFSKRAPIGSVAIASNPLCTNQGCLSCVPMNNSNSKYYYYLMSVLQEQFELEGSGTTFKEISASSFSNFVIPAPSMQIQDKIASFLDTECSKIDSLIATLQKRVELLKELRQSVITKAVTKGLDPDVKMKDSGVEWIGDVPEHWTIIRTKFLGTIRSGDSIPSSEVKECGTFEVYGGNGLAGYCSRNNVENEEIIIGRVGALCGNVRISRGKRFVTDNALILTCNDNVLIDYLFLVLECANLNNLNTSSAQPLITGTKVLNVFAPLPSVDEQIKVIKYVEKLRLLYDTAVLNAKRQIKLLKEYKQSLITEVVTGKRKVC